MEAIRNPAEAASLGEAYVASASELFGLPSADAEKFSGASWIAVSLSGFGAETWAVFLTSSLDANSSDLRIWPASRSAKDYSQLGADLPEPIGGKGLEALSPCLH